jgi:hypothetical protein
MQFRAMREIAYKAMALVIRTLCELPEIKDKYLAAAGKNGTYRKQHSATSQAK